MDEKLKQAWKLLQKEAKKHKLTIGSVSEAVLKLLLINGNTPEDAVDILLGFKK